MWFFASSFPNVFLPDRCGLTVEVRFLVDPKLVISVEEAGEILGISRGLAYDLVRRGELPSLRLGRRWVVPRRRLMALIEGEVAVDDSVVNS